MPRYYVTFLVDATHTIEVDADNEEQARDKAYEEVGSPCLCHQCANEIELGDVQELISSGEV